MRRRGRPVLGAIAGLLFGLFLGLDLFILGVVPLDSALISILVLLGLAGGLALGILAPFGAKEPVAPDPEDRPA